jgi:curved DNA-binding protein CbpA
VASDIDPYKVLQVDPEAEDEVVQAAYRRLAQKYHPDRHPGPDGATRMIAINAAWELVGDPAKRAAFDRSRAAARQSPPPSAAPPAAPTPTPRPAADAPGSPTTRERPPETVSRDWTSGRSNAGGGYDASMRKAEGEGAAGPPPGNPSGSVLTFGRYAGWSIGEIARRDLEYLEWLDRMAIGRMYRDEIDVALRKGGRRRSATADGADQRGLFRRR